MARRKLALLMLASIAVSTLGNISRAADAHARGDGCTELARLVYAEVTEYAWYGSGRVALSLPSPIEYRVAVCGQTTRTVSRAFALAMTALGEDIGWGYPYVDRGDFCYSGFLQQCYPERYPIGGIPAWSAVQGVISHAMPQGAASDRSVFSTTAMRLALRAALAESATQR